MCDWVSLVSTAIICATVLGVAWLVFRQAKIHIDFHEPKD